MQPMTLEEAKSEAIMFLSDSLTNLAHQAIRNGIDRKEFMELAGQAWKYAETVYRYKTGVAR